MGAAERQLHPIPSLILNNFFDRRENPLLTKRFKETMTAPQGHSKKWSTNVFFRFLLFYEIESLKGMMGLGISLSGCLHTRKIITKNIKMLE
jgi:hypothetical protein